MIPSHVLYGYARQMMTIHVLYVLLFFRRAEAKAILKSSLAERSNSSSAEDDYWDSRAPNVMDEVGLYATAVAGGFALLIIAGHLLLLLYLIIDSISTRTIVMDRTFRRNSIPKIILDRVIQDEDYDDVSWDEVLDAEGFHAHDQLVSDARQETEESGIDLPKEDRKSIKSISDFNEEDHLRWLRTIYCLIQMSHAMQVFINNNKVV